VEIVNAVNSTGRFLGSVMTDCKSNEIPAAPIAAPTGLAGKIVVADALHTQEETARQISTNRAGTICSRSKPTS